MSLEQVTLPTRNFVGFAHKGPYHEIGATFGKLASWAKGHNMLDRSFIGVYYDNPNEVAPENLRAHALVEVRPGENPEGEGLDHVVMPAGNYFKSTHMGSYDGLPEAWSKFMAEVSATGKSLDYNWTYEDYVNDCDSVPEPEIQTDLYAGLIQS